MLDSDSLAAGHAGSEAAAENPHGGRGTDAHANGTRAPTRLALPSAEAAECPTTSCKGIPLYPVLALPTEGFPQEG